MTYTLTVISVISETLDAKTFVLKQPKFRKIKYHAGQYLIFLITINGRKYRRAYSLSSSPTLDQNLKVTIKRTPNGLVSNFLIDHCKEGDLIEVLEPNGDFIFNFESLVKEVYLWAAGSGITPLFSILNELLVKHESLKINLIYGNSTYENSIFVKELISLQKKYIKRFKITLFFSQENDTNYEFSFLGRINKEFINRNLLLNQTDTKKALHFICGPSDMKNMVTYSLINLGVEEKNIISEDFGLVINEKDFKEVVNSEVTLIMKNRSIKVHLNKGKSLLNGFLDENHELPYSCLNGNCNKCKAVLKSGIVKLIGMKKTDDLFDGEILLCCSYPTTDKIEIEIEINL